MTFKRLLLLIEIFIEKYLFVHAVLLRDDDFRNRNRPSLHAIYTILLLGFVILLYFSLKFILFLVSLSKHFDIL